MCATQAKRLHFAEELYGELTKRFGRALLLVLLSGQAVAVSCSGSQIH